MPGLISAKTFWVPVVIAGLGAMTVASAQTSGSPFAVKKKKQAWETPAPVTPAPAVPSYTEPSYTGPLTPPAPGGSNYEYKPSPSLQQYEGVPAPLAGPPPTPAPTSGAYFPGREKGGQAQQLPNYSQTPNYAQSPNYGQSSAPGRMTQRMPGQRKQFIRQSWKDKYGLGKIKLAFDGFIRGGAAAVQRKSAAGSNWREDFIGDGAVEFEASTITQGGLEYGVNVEIRGQYDKYRKGFGGRVGDCPPGIAGCNSVLVGGTPTSVRGHTSRFYASGPANQDEVQVGIESLHIFLRSAYGDVTLGRDDGAAYLFSLGAPSLLAVNASNSPVDYTGLDSVKTVNDASGFAEKLTYTSPRLLGDKIGVGVQFGVSYAPGIKVCGVDYCVKSDFKDPSGAISPDLENVMELGLSLDRKFDNGLGIEVTGSYARASEQSGLAAFDDLSAWNTGIEVTLADWTVGGSYLHSNNGLANGDYTAYDAGITWKPSKLGFTASYGHAEDDNINLKSDQFVFGATYEFNKFTLGTGVQYIERSAPVLSGLVLNSEKEKATALFVEGGFKF